MDKKETNEKWYLVVFVKNVALDAPEGSCLCKDTVYFVMRLPKFVLYP
jgi:hypothetical protein